MTGQIAVAGSLALGAWLSLHASQDPRVRTAPAGDATIQGTVLADDTLARPLRRAVVTISGAGLPLSRSVVSDDEGRFSIGSLAAGRVVVTAAKPGYLPGSYGASRAGRPGTPLVLAAGETREIAISLARGGVLAGTIRDDRGAPVAGLQVFAIDALRPVAPEPRPGRTGSRIDNRGVVTDDLGLYRLYGLPPGSYFVVAVPPAVRAGEVGTRSTREMDALLSQLESRRAGRGFAGAAAVLPVEPAGQATLAPSYYPGTLTMNDAGRIRLAAGEVREALDFVAGAVPVTTLAGTVVSSDGALPADLELSIAPGDTLQFFALATSAPQLVRRPGADGLFAFSTVAAGSYVIRARGRRGAAAPLPAGRGVPPPGARGSAAGRGSGAVDDQLYAIETVQVVDTPIAGVTLRLLPASEFRGRVTVQAPVPLPGGLSSLRVDVAPVVRTGMTVRDTSVGSNFTEARSANVLVDGTFAVAGLAPGRYHVSVNVTVEAGPDWWLRSALVGGRDVLDTTLEVPSGADVADAVLTLVNRRTALSGTLQTPAGLPAHEYFVVVFPADPARRLAGSRRVKFTRPASDGSFSFTDLPPGDYRLVALTDIEPDAWQSAGFLEALADQGVSVRVNETTDAHQDLRVLAP